MKRVGQLPNENSTQPRTRDNYEENEQRETGSTSVKERTSSRKIEAQEIAEGLIRLNKPKKVGGSCGFPCGFGLTLSFSGISNDLYALIEPEFPCVLFREC